MQGIDTASTLKQLIFAYKGSQFCAKERAEFVLCRATPAGKLGDPELCEGKVANFLQCFHDMVKESNAACQKQYEGAFECLSKHTQDHENLGDAEGACTRALEEFAKCRQ